MQAESEEGAGCTRVLRKADAAVGQEEARLDPPDGIRNQRFEFLALLGRDCGTQILDFDQALAYEDNLRHFVHAAHPGIADELRVKGGDADGLFRISCRSRFPFENARCSVQFSDGIDVSYEIISRSELAIELDLLVRSRPMNANATVLGKAVEQLDALLQHVVPGVMAGVGQVHVFAQTPLLKEHSGRIFPAEERGDGLFKGAAEKHGRAGIFFLPGVKVAVPVAARAAQILADLGIGVGHQDAFTVLETFEAGVEDSFSHWLAGANPSKFTRDTPLIVVWLILTMPRSPGKAFSSICSCAKRSGS